MSTKAKFLCSSLVLSLVIMGPATIGAESVGPSYDKASQLFEQLQDLESMQRNIEEYYQAVRRTPMVPCLSGQSWRAHAELDDKLMNRVFGHLAGTPEYERFITEHRILIQRPDYRRLHTDELFVEYMRLLESGRRRFVTQLKEWQERLQEKRSAEAREGSAQSIPVKTVAFEPAEGSQTTDSGRVASAIPLQVQIPLTGSAPLAVGRQSVVRIVVHGMDQSGSAIAAAPTDMVELHIFVAQERVVAPEQVSLGDHHGLVKGARSGTGTGHKLSDPVEKGAGAWDQ